ncbi:MAG TPA: hypothetical protein VJA16_08255 [Thermoanaerobaculia bacterium]
MSRTAQRALQVLSWSAAAALACSLAAAQDSAPPSIAEQLQAQYKLAKLTRDANGNVVVAEGTVLAIQKEGIMAVPLTNPLNPCPSTYDRGRLKAPAFLCQVAAGVVEVQPTNLAVGQQAYPASIAVDSKKDMVKFMVVACAGCNGNDPPTYYKATVDFKFPKGLLATGDASQVEDTIGQVFLIDTSAAAAQGQDAQAASAPASAPAASAVPAPEPVNVQQGQTIAEVEQALGKPLKILTTSKKVIYVYHDLKVTFTNGKVADVQ